MPCTGEPGHKVEFRKSSSRISNLAASDALFAAPVTSPSVVARALDDGRPVINYFDTGQAPTGPPTPTPIDSAALLSTTKGSFSAGEDNDFGMRSTGLLNITTQGTYTFSVGSDDGFRLRIGSPLELVMQADVLRPFSATSGNKAFPVAGCYPYQLDFFERDQAAGVHFYASGPGITANSLVGGSGGIPVLDGNQPPEPPTTTSTTSTTLPPATSTTLAPTTTSSMPVSTTRTSTTTTSAPATPTTTVARGGPSVQAPPEGPAGLQIVLSGSGFGANEPLTATLNSTPVLLATLNASAAGTFTVTVRIPQNATAGQHTIVVAGASGRSASAPFRVSETRSAPLARTGSPVRGPLALAALFLMLGNAALLWSSRSRHPLA
ncbi:MAG: PA14 domain-containing protein [Actinomycetota bacterium]|nr:PA14 domain-containing protein [Actinomycetota bacterium]